MLFRSRVNSEKKAEDMIRTFLVEEYEAYPVLKFDDTLNCFGLMMDDAITIRKPEPDYTVRIARQIRRAERQERSVMTL